MSYYADLGDAQSDCNAKPDMVWNDSAGCVTLDENLRIINAGVAAASSSGTPSSSASGSGGGILDSIGKLLGGAAAGAVQAKFAPKPQPFSFSTGMPTWIMPVAIVGVGLLAVVMLTGPRRSAPAPAAAPVKNPHRRRRRRRRR